VLRRNSNVLAEFQQDYEWNVKFYMFEMLNQNEWLQGSEAARVAERGPYIYKMTVHRIIDEFAKHSVVFHNNRQYFFDPQNSFGSRDGYDKPLNMPNIPYLVTFLRFLIPL
jgi:hypothetical protein